MTIQVLAMFSLLAAVSLPSVTPSLAGTEKSRKTYHPIPAPGEAPPETEMLRVISQAQKEVKPALPQPCGDRSVKSAEKKPPLCAEGELNLKEVLPREPEETPSEIVLKQQIQKALTQANHELTCIEKDLWEDLWRLYRSMIKAKWECSIQDTYKLLKAIENNRAEWEKTAKETNSVQGIRIYLPSTQDPKNYAEIYVKPNGEILIRYKNRKLGEGTVKRADTLFSVKPDAKGRIQSVKSLVILTEKDPEDKGAALEEEMRIYRKIDQYKKSLPAGTDFSGLAEAELITLRNKQKAMIQTRYESDLEHSKLLLNPETRLKVLRSVATGLGHLHKMGLVHGDFKAENVLANPTGEVAVADFGLTTDPTKKVFTRTTARYEAPEMVDEEKLHKSNDVQRIQKRDVYGFGVLILRSFPNYSDDTAFDRCYGLFVDYKSWNGPPGQEKYGDCYKRQAGFISFEWNRKANETCPPIPRSNCLIALAAECLNPDPTNRPTMEEVRNRLQNVQEVPVPGK